jgi:AcrR family transcriptional regulator
MGRPSLRDERRKQILAAFESCVLKYGLEGSTLDRVAEEAGVRRTLIRHYVGNRADLTQALIDRVREQTIAGIRGAARTSDGPQSVGSLIDVLVGPTFPDERDDALIDALMAAMHRDPQLKEQQRVKYDDYVKTLAEELGGLFPSASPADVHAVAYALVCLAVGNASMYDVGLSSREPDDARQAGRVLVASLAGPSPQRGASSPLYR